MVKGKKLSSIVLASLLIAGGVGIFGGQQAFAEVSDSAFAATQALANSNSSKISAIDGRVTALETAGSSAVSKADIDQLRSDTASTASNLQNNINKLATDTKAGFEARDKTHASLQTNINKNTNAINAERETRATAVNNLQNNINKNTNYIDKVNDNFKTSNALRYQETRDNKAAIEKAVADQAAINTAQGTINDNLTNAVQQNSQAIVTTAKAAENLEKHLGETDGRVDQANAEIHTNAGNIAQNKLDIQANKDALDNALTNQNTVNDTLTKAVQQNSQAIVTTAKAAQNLEKHLTETDGRVDQANAEIHTNAGNIAQLQKDQSDVKEAAATWNTVKDQFDAAAQTAATYEDRLKTVENLSADNYNKLKDTDDRQATTGDIGLVTGAHQDENGNWVEDTTTIEAGNKEVGKNIGTVAQAVAQERGARIAADKAQDKVIQQVNQNLADNVGKLNLQDYNEAVTRDAADKKLAADQQVTSESDLIKKDNTIGQNVTNVDTALHNEIAARIGADAAQDKVIQQVNQNLADNVTKLNQQDANEAAARDAADQKLAADQQVTSESDLIKKDNTIGQNVTNVDTALHNEIAARIGADKAQDKVIQQVNQNAANGIAALKQASDNETAARVAGDKQLQSNIESEANTRATQDQVLANSIAAESQARGDAVSRLNDRIQKTNKEIDQVGAMSMAIAGLHPLSYDDGDARFQLSAAVGTYDGTQALALGGFYHFNRDSMLSIGMSTDTSDFEKFGANIGYTRRIGQGGHRPTDGTVSDIMKDIQELKAKQDALEQENEDLKAQLAALQK